MIDRKFLGSAVLSTARTCSVERVSAMKSATLARSLRNAAMFMLTCGGAVKTSGENFWPPDPNVAGADGEMSSVKSNDVSSTRSTPPSRMVASTTENGESTVATGLANIGEDPAASAG